MKYEKPEMEVVEFKAKEIVVTSGGDLVVDPDNPTSVPGTGNGTSTGGYEW